MHSSIHVAPRIAAALIFVFLIDVASGWAAAPIGRTAVRCQRAITVAGQAFLVRQLSDLGRCVGAALSCTETAADDAECLIAVGTRCERTVARILRREAKLAGVIAGRCRTVDPEVLIEPTGLGFAALAPVCPALGTGHGDAAVLGACLASLQRCRGERLFASTVPRAGELLRVADVPARVRADLACLPDRGGSGRGVRDADAGAAITRCARSMARAGARLVTRTLANASLCTRTTRACFENAVDETPCLADATSTCTGAFARVAAARQAFGRAVAAACGEDRIDFALLAAPTGIALDALADECAEVQIDQASTLPALAECLARRHECDVIALLRDATPRAEELLAVVGRTVARPYCSAPQPTERATPTSAPTPTAAGPTPTARPGETATPTPQATPTRTRPQPTATPFCGNGVIDDGEECDGQELDDNTCEDLCFESDPNGLLRCTACRFDFGMCGGVDCEAP